LEQCSLAHLFTDAFDILGKADHLVKVEIGCLGKYVSRAILLLLARLLLGVKYFLLVNSLVGLQVGKGVDQLSGVFLRETLQFRLGKGRNSRRILAVLLAGKGSTYLDVGAVQSESLSISAGRGQVVQDLFDALLEMTLFLGCSCRLLRLLRRGSRLLKGCVATNRGEVGERVGS
jgi:hypothetical protein